jgi:hypothetical protein
MIPKKPIFSENGFLKSLKENASVIVTVIAFVTYINTNANRIATIESNHVINSNKITELGHQLLQTQQSMGDVRLEVKGMMSELRNEIKELRKDNERSAIRLEENLKDELRGYHRGRG